MKEITMPLDTLGIPEFRHTVCGRGMSLCNKDAVELYLKSRLEVIWCQDGHITILEPGVGVSNLEYDVPEIGKE